jgi:hypothetical protein
MRPLAFILMTAALACSAATVGETDRFIPLVQDGGGWTTELTLVNILKKPASVSVTFMNEKGSNEIWKLSLKSTVGKVFQNGVELVLAPGASATITTGGEGAAMSRGFADVVDFQEQVVAGYARLVRREAGAIVEQIRIPLSPANERRSIVSLDLLRGESLAISWVTLTTSTTLDVTFRNEAGAVVFSDVVRLDQSAHAIVDLLEQWPRLAGFKGTMEWTVSFPNADRYEHRTLAAVILHRSAETGRLIGISSAMTLPSDQLSTSPY